MSTATFAAAGNSAGIERFGAPAFGVDADVIERAGAGDECAFLRIVCDCRRDVAGVVTRLTGCPEDAEEVSLEVFDRLHGALRSWRQGAFEVCLYRIIAGAARAYLEKARGRPGVCAELNRLLDGVRPEDRVLLLLKEVEGLRWDELERIFGRSRRVLETRIGRVRQELARAIGGR